MTPVRSAAPGATRTCPHCKATILESASVCPACRHKLRFEPGVARRASSAGTPLRVDGTISHPADAAPLEYSILLVISDGRGEELTRHVAGVGVLRPADRRTFSVAVEVFETGPVPIAPAPSFPRR